jgi:hypothetical protein
MANDDKQRFPNRDDISLSEEIVHAKKGNKETLRVMGDNVGDIDKVLELKKDHTKTTAYIKALEMAHQQQIKETPITITAPAGSIATLNNQRYYVPSKIESMGIKLPIGLVVIFGSIGGICEYGVEAPIYGFYALAGILLAYGLVFGIVFLFKLIGQSHAVQRNQYERAKRWIAIVLANGNRIPAPGTRQAYLQDIEFARQYEAEHPEEYEPYRDWLSPEDRAFLQSQCVKGKRKSYYT